MLTQIYQSEFENTLITKDELQLKYNLEALPEGHEGWTKASHLIVSSKPPQPQSTNEDDSLNAIIADAKLSLVQEVQSRIANEKGYLEIKDLKDLSSILLNLEDKKAGSNTPTVSILVQNLVSKFSQEDV